MRPLNQTIITFAAALLLGVLVRTAAAQSPTMSSVTPAGVAVAAGQSYSLSSFEQYNSFNGTLGTVLPLRHIGGRGEAGFDLAWNLQPGWLAANIGIPGVNSFVAIDPYPSNNVAGATNAYALGGPGAVYLRTGGSWTPCGQGYAISSTVTSVVFVTAGGSQVTLTDTATNGAAKAVPGNACASNPSSPWDGGRGTSFRSTDGSQIQFNADSNVLEQPMGNAGYGVAKVSGNLVFPNGVTYRIDNSTVSWIRDRNGNLITLSYGGPLTQIDWYLNVPALTQVTDSLNRVTTINYSDTTAASNCNGCLSINYAGVGGAQRQIKVITGNLAGNLRSGYSLMTIAALFPNSGQPTSYNFNPTVASAVVLPDATEYTFQYNSYGELARVTLPTGGAIEYDYGDGNNGSGSGYQAGGNGGVMIYRRLQKRREYVNGGTTASSVTTYTAGYPGGQTTDTVQLYDASGVNLLSQTKHTFTGSPTDALSMTGTSCNIQNEGLEVQTDSGGPTSLVTVKNSYGPPACATNPQLLLKVTTLNDTNQQSQVAYSYDGYGNVANEVDYDWGAGAPGGVLRKVATYYLYQQTAAYAAANVNLVRAPWYRQTYDSGGNRTAESDWHYDETAPANAPGLVGHDANYGTGYTLRGNLASSYQWLNPGNTFLPTKYSYDIAGNVLSVTDPKNQTTSFSYTDNYSGGSYGTYALPTVVVNAKGQTTYAAQYDYSTGQALSSTDSNGNSTSYIYNDPLDRLTGQQNNALNALTTYAYGAYSTSGPTSVRIRQDQNTSGDQALETEQDWDGFGRPVASDVYTDASHFITTLTTYDGAGRVATVSNPFRPGTDAEAVTTYAYDTLGRPVSVTTADGAVAPTRYAGNTTTVADQAGHARALTMDGLGRLVQVVEDPSASGYSGLNYQTFYSYDTLGNLKTVTQGVCPSCQSRTFGYDSLSRLLSATNLESGTTSYTYDNDGNPQTRTNGNGVTASCTFDPLNRPLSVSYSDGVTPSVSYGYDAAGVANSNGHLTSVANGVSTTNYTGFDAWGNATGSSQSTAGQTYVFSYGYNLAGALVSETYPSGRVVATGYDGANRAVSVSGKWLGQATSYVSNTGFWPQGAPSTFTYGNGVTHGAAYNTRLQLLESYDALNNQNTASNMLLVTCPNWGGPSQSINAVYQLCPGWNAVSNNGNLQGLTIQQGTQKFAQTFSYDAVNRLTGASEAGGWSQSYGYDPYGNMWLPSNAGLPAYGPMPSANLYSGANQNPNMSYDGAGNQTVLGALKLSYNAENRQVGATSTLGEGAAVYQYDGAGQRVAKTVAGQTTVYVYDAFGVLKAEYDSQSVVAPPCATCYLSYDHLGSVRMVTDQNGVVVARHDFAPYGQEIPAGVGARSSLWGSTSDVEQKFTGQLRDNETGEDYFNARYMANLLGRFMSADPANAGADLANPQSWNGYAYVLGNPLDATDPDGLFAQAQPSACTNWACAQAILSQIISYVGSIPGMPPPPTVPGPGSKPELPANPQGPASNPVPAKTGNGTCAAQRLASGIFGAVNLGLAAYKAQELPSVVVGLASTGAGAPAAGVAAAYGTMSIFGQALTGAAQIYSAATGNYGRPAKVAQIGSILSGPVSGLGTLVAGGSLAQAERNANYESMFTAGTGIVDGLMKESFGFVTGLADWSFTYLGMQPGSSCGGGH